MSDDYDILIRGEIVKRKFVPDNVVLYQNWLDKHDGKRVQFALSRERKKRSNAQLEYYWGALIFECNKARGEEHIERNKEAIHGHFQRKVLLPYLVELESRSFRSDQELLTPVSTGALTSEQMTEYIERCKDYAARKWNVHVPDINLVKLKGR